LHLRQRQKRFEDKNGAPQLAAKQKRAVATIGKTPIIASKS
jgi:hypothetical protein